MGKYVPASRSLCGLLNVVQCVCGEDTDNKTGRETTQTERSVELDDGIDMPTLVQAECGRRKVLARSVAISLAV